jgi:hypothetical protein
MKWDKILLKFFKNLLTKDMVFPKIITEDKIMKVNTFITLLVFTGFFGFSACNLETNNSTKGFYFDEETFTSEWDSWKNKDIKNYCFTITGKLSYWNFSRAILMYEYKVNIIVKDGIMDSFEYIGNVPHGEDINSILEPEFTSISDIYQKISDGAKKEKEWWEKYSGNGGIISTTYVIKYDTQLHYIALFEPVSKWKPDYIVDTTAHAVNISNFTILDDK